mgnify:CR=1 FL=1
MLFGGRKMKHKKQKKMKKAGHILLAVFAVVIGTLGVPVSYTHLRAHET